MNSNITLDKNIKENIEFYQDDDSYEEESNTYSIVRDAALEGNAIQAGIKINNLQQAIDNYAMAMNKSAIAQSTGLPVKTPIQQYKGFAAEEYFKQTLKINALAQGIPDYKIGVYTKGQMPDGTVLSGIDMETDISIWTRRTPWSQPTRIIDYQSKIHNNASAYAKDISNPQYKNVNFVGGSGQGVNDRVQVIVDGQWVASDSITPEKASQLANDMKNQSVRRYAKSQEKFDELNSVNLENTLKVGATTGFVLTTIQEIIGVIKNSKKFSEEEFVASIKRVLCGTAENTIRAGAIHESVRLLSKMLNRQVSANSFEAIPAMTVATVAVDFAKDLYKCFVDKTIDTDDLLCNSVDNVFKSATGLCGAHVTGQIAGKFSSHFFMQEVCLHTSARTIAATGASIGSTLGPLGTVVGSVVGGIIFGLGANAIIGTAKKDARKAFTDCIADINSHIELSGREKLYYFADSMGSLSDFRLSFKNLLPCYNLISDLSEYNMRKKAIKAVTEQLENNLGTIDYEKTKILQEIKRQHQERIDALREVFIAEKKLLTNKFKEDIKTTIGNSYTQYIKVSEIINGNINELIEDLDKRKTDHSYILDYMHNRNSINNKLNETLHDLFEEDNDEVKRLVNDITTFIKQDELMIGRQYISFDEALVIVKGGTF